ncbi:hypothetical protein [Streptosporangium sp. NPDC049644]
MTDPLAADPPRDRPVLLIGTSLDTVTPCDAHHEAAVTAYQA